MSASDIRAGGAYIEIFTKDVSLQRGLDAVAGRVRAFASGVQAIGAGLASWGTKAMAMGAALLAPLALGVKAFADMGSSLVDMSDRTGIGVEALSELTYAAQMSGTGMADVEAGVRKMQRAITNAAQGSRSAQEALAQLGLNVQNLAGMSPEDQFTAIAQRIAAIEDPTRRAAMAMEIFGKSGTRLLPMLRDVEQLRQRARDLGLTMTAEDAAAAEEFGDALETIGLILRRAAAAIGGAMIPVLRSLADGIADLSGPIVGWINANRGMVSSIGLAVGGLFTAGAAMLATGLGISILGRAIAPLAGAFGLLGRGAGVLGGLFGSALGAGSRIAGVGLSIVHAAASGLNAVFAGLAGGVGLAGSALRTLVGGALSAVTAAFGVGAQAASLFGRGVAAAVPMVYDAMAGATRAISLGAHAIAFGFMQSVRGVYMLQSAVPVLGMLQRAGYAAADALRAVTVGLPATIQATGAALQALPSTIASGMSAAAGLVQSAWSGAAGLAGSLWTSAAGMAARAWTALTGLPGILGAAFRAAGAVASVAWSGASAIASAAWSAFSALGGVLSTAFAASAAAASAAWTSAMAGTSGASAVLMTIPAALSAAWAGAASLASAAWTGLSAIGGLVAGAFTAAAGVVSAMWTAAPSLASVAWGAFAAIPALLTGSHAVAAGMVSALWTALPGVIATAWSAMAAALPAVLTVAAIAGAGVVVYYLGRQVWPQVISAAQKAWTSISSMVARVFGAVWESVKSAAAGVWGWISESFGSAVSSIRGTFSTVFTGIWSGVQSFFGDCAAGFQNVMADGQEAFGAIADALQAGDLGTAFSAAVAFLRMEWARLTNWFTDKWLEFKAEWIETISGFELIWNDVAARIKTIWAELVGWLTKTWNDFANSGWSEWWADAIAPIMAKVTGQKTEDIRRTIKEDFARARENAFNYNAGIDAETARRTAEIETGRQARAAEIGQQQSDFARNRAAQEQQNQANYEQAQRNYHRTVNEPLMRMAEDFTQTEEQLASWSDVLGIDVETLRGLGAGDQERPGAPDTGALQLAKDATSGTFNPFAALGLGGGSVFERTARAAEETARNTRNLRDRDSGDEEGAGE